MRRFLKGLVIVAINALVFVLILAGIETYYRVYPVGPAPVFSTTNGLWQKFHSYTMFMTAPGSYPGWTNTYTGKSYPADVRTNSLGFNDPHEFDYSTPYEKAPNERVVLFTGGSTAWGVGASATDKTVAGRMQHHLNRAQSQVKYTVINMSMGSWIAFQEFLALELWGEPFAPDWIVTMDGHNDAGVGCAYGQGIGNPMYFATVQSYVDGYLFSSQNPPFYRGWFENEIIKYSAAYRALTGRQYVPQNQILDASSAESSAIRRQMIPTKMGDTRQILQFYMKAMRGILRLFPDAKYILSTQPSVNQFTGLYVDIYKYPPGSPERRAAMLKREEGLEKYLTHYQSDWCSQAANQVTTTYIMGNGAIQLERLVESERAEGRAVEYYNTGELFPDDRPSRMPFFIDPAHMSDEGYDAVGKFFAGRILASDGLAGAAAVVQP